jgi:predicted O-methyltransferase YrrM
MTAPEWSEVDAFLEQALRLEDDLLRSARRATVEAGLPDIAVTATQGRMLQLLARSVGSRAILEIGTLGGYSTIWLGRALLPGGRLVSLEIDPACAAVARANLAAAGLARTCDVRLGAALDLLPEVAAASPSAFDFVFIDADKPGIPVYFDWALRLARPGGLIVVDNVVRGGAVRDAASRDERVIGARTLVESLADEPRVLATVVQTVGRKGYDGFVLAVVLPTA